VESSQQEKGKVCVSILGSQRKKEKGTSGFNIRVGTPHGGRGLPPSKSGGWGGPLSDQKQKILENIDQKDIGERIMTLS